jgi:hypothetical protein
VRIGTRITAATALVVTLTLTVYAFFEVRARADNRQRAIESEARATGLALRTTLETLGADIAHVDPLRLTRDLGRELGRSGAGWRVSIVAADDPGPGKPPAGPGLSVTQRRRLAALTNAPQLALLERERGDLVLALPLRAQGKDGIEVTGMLELARPVAYLEAAWRGDVWRAIGYVVVIAALTTIAVFLATRSVMTRPMAKLLAASTRSPAATSRTSSCPSATTRSARSRPGSTT